MPKKPETSGNYSRKHVLRAILDMAEAGLAISRRALKDSGVVASDTVLDAAIANAVRRNLIRHELVTDASKPERVCLRGACGKHIQDYRKAWKRRWEGLRCPA